MLPDKQRYSINEVLQIFELSRNEIPDITKQHPSVEIAQKVVDEFKLIIKKQYRKLVFKYHPDHGGDEKDFKVLQRIYTTMIETIQVTPMRRRRPMHMHMRVYRSGTSTTSASTTTTAGNYYRY